jgi:hypothetical protein
MAHDTDKDLQAWDLYAAAAITAIAGRGPIDASELAEEARHYADAMLQLRRKQASKLYDEWLNS